MIKEEKINGLIFLAQTTFYIYESEEDRQNSRAILTTSDKRKFEANKIEAHKNELKDSKNKFVVL